MAGKHVVVLIGPPGCGKGTQGRLISREFGIPELSTGDMLREEATRRTARGRRVRSLLDRGSLVDDATIDAVLAARLAERDCRRGFILDGYPRTISQARTLDRLLERLDMPEPAVLQFEIAASALIERLTARRVCPACGRIYNLLHHPPAQSDACDDDGSALMRRSDDQPRVILNRLRVYRELTGPLIHFYRGRNSRRIDASCSPERVYEDVREHLTSVLAAV